MDSADAADLLEALTLLDDLGAVPAASKVRRTLRRLGVQGVPRGPRRQTRSHPAGLTPRQVEVLELVAEGLTNAEIAERLFVSPKTVDHHVSALLAKRRWQHNKKRRRSRKPKDWCDRTLSEAASSQCACSQAAPLRPDSRPATSPPLRGGDEEPLGLVVEDHERAAGVGFAVDLHVNRVDAGVVGAGAALGERDELGLLALTHERRGTVHRP